MQLAILADELIVCSFEFGTQHVEFRVRQSVYLPGNKFFHGSAYLAHGNDTVFLLAELRLLLKHPCHLAILILCSGQHTDLAVLNNKVASTYPVSITLVLLTNGLFNLA